MIVTFGSMMAGRSRGGLAAAVVAGLVLGALPVARAQVSYPVEVKKFAGTQADKKAPEWCWAASVRAVLALYGVDLSQTQILAATLDEDDNGPDRLHERLSSIRVATLPAAEQVVEVATSSFQQGAPAPSVLLDAIGHGRPIIAWFHGPEGRAHAVVVRGVRVMNAGEGPVVTFVKIADPWPGVSERVMDASAFEDAIDGWFVVGGARTKLRPRARW